MEIISLYALVAIVASLLGWYGFRWLRRKLQPIPVAEEGERDLSDTHVRKGLTDFLARHKIVGDADIRNGFVLAPVPPERLEPLAIVLGNAAAFISRLRNPSASSIYIRDSVNDRFMLLGDLDLDHLVDASRVMQRVAEDRRKTRSLYKGLTDDEMRSMVRAGMSQWLKDDGEFGHSNEVMTGLWDERPEFLMALNVLDLLFKVKGASNG
jgi:hypothetical protein